ncbi:MAG: hypothetical protein J5645_05160, partial [Lachnospiraceae bacterium]|nr:hypothetical protein [Lachnospiraceae bacterium]
MKVYPDTWTERSCKGIMIGGIAEAVIMLAVLVTTIVTKNLGQLHPTLRLIAYACFIIGAAFYAYAAYIGMRPKFGQFFFYASIATCAGSALLGVDAAISFSMADQSGHILMKITQLLIIATSLSSAIFIAFVGDDARSQFYKLSDDRLMCAAIGILNVLSGFFAIICALADKGGSPMKIWEAIGFFFMTLIIYAIPVVFLYGCSRLTDPVTDREIEEGLYASAEKKDGKDSKDKKPSDKKDSKDKKSDKDKKDGKDKDKFAKDNKGKGDKNDKNDKNKDKDKEKDKSDKTRDKDKGKGFGLLKGKDKKDDKKEDKDEHESGDVISTTKHKPVKSTNPTDLDAFLREAEEEDERKVRDAVWEAAREKEKEAEPEKSTAGSTVFSEKISKKNKKKDKKKNKDKGYSAGVNTALFTNPNKPKEKKYIPTVSVGLNNSEEPEESGEEISISELLERKAAEAKAAETAANETAAEAVTEVSAAASEEVETVVTFAEETEEAAAETV